MKRPQELPIPAAVLTAEQARELARLWAVDGQQVVTFPTRLWDDPGNWGILLVDFARHIADAYQQTTGITSAEALQRIRDGFDAEWNVPTDEPSGEIAGDDHSSR